MHIVYDDAGCTFRVFNAAEFLRLTNKLSVNYVCDKAIRL